MKENVIKVWPLLAIIVLCLIFFYPVWLKGLIPLPADFVVGTYYPWLDYKWGGFGAGVPVKNPITTDVVSFIYPMQMFAIEQLKLGMIPLWNNLILAGTPLMANFQSAPFSPTNFVYFLLPNLTAWSLQVMLQPILAALFLFLLLKELGRGNLASAAGGIFFAFAGFITIWMQWNGHGLVAAFFPLIILLVLKWIKTPDPKTGLLLSVSLVMQIFSGYPQIIIYEMLALFLLITIFDYKCFFNLPKIAGLGLFLLLGIGLSALQTLPAYELLTLSQRKVELVLNEWAFLPWQLIITFFAPDFFGSHTTRNYWGPADYTLTTSFSGVIVIILASLAVILNLKDKGVRFGLSLVLLSLAVTFPNPLTVAIKESGFLGLQAASAHRILVLSNLGFAILSAFGIDLLISKSVKPVQLLRALYLPIIFLGGFLAASAGILVFSVDPILAANLKVGLKNLVLPFSLLAAVSILFLLYFKFKSVKLTVAPLMVILAVAELFRFGWKFTPFSPREFVFPQTPVIEFLQQQQKPFRVSAEDVIPINFMMNYRIETIEGYDAVYPLTVAKYLSTLNSGQIENTPMGRYGSVTNYESKLLDLANVKYILALKRDQDGRPSADGLLPEKFNKEHLKKVFEDKTVVVLENIKVVPRAFISYSWDVEKGDQILKSLLSSDQPYQYIYVEAEADQPEEHGRGSVDLSTYQANLIKISSDKKGLLYVGNTWFSGWKAEIDGQKKDFIRANYNFMAVPITAGEHQVRLIYQPDGFEFGKVISIWSLAALLSVSLGWYLLRRKRKAV